MIPYKYEILSILYNADAVQCWFELNWMRMRVDLDGMEREWIWQLSSCLDSCRMLWFVSGCVVGYKYIECDCLHAEDPRAYSSLG